MEDVLEQDGVSLHALDLGDGVHDAGALRGPLELDQDADRHDDLLPDGTLGQLDPTHHDHGLQTAEQLDGVFAWTVVIDPA